MTALWLSRIRLRDDARMQAIADLILPREPRREVLSTRHKLVWSFFADSPDRDRDFLWREDKRGVFYTLSTRKPRASDMFEAESTAFSPVLATGDRLIFALRANPVVSRKAPDAAGAKRGKRHDMVMDRLRNVPPGERGPARQHIIREAGRDWLVAQGARHGFTVESVKSDSYHQHILPRKNGQRPGKISTLDLEGIIRITDPQRFLTQLPTGFGPAKAFGCGLMLIRRV